MAALTSTTGAPPMRDTTVPPGMRAWQPRGASTTYYTRGLVMHRAGSDIVEHPLSASPRTDLIAAGIVVGSTAAYTTGVNTDSNGGALDANGYRDVITVETGIVGWFDTGTGSHQITNANVDQVCYAFDNNTLYLDNLNGTLSAAGYVAKVREDGKVKLRIDPSVYLVAQDALPANAQNGSARAVVTSLHAYTGSLTGQLTSTATGAFGTQDGVSTLAVGDVVFIPPVISNLTDIGDAGPWEITVIGSSSPAVKWVLTRPAWFAHGAVMGMDRTVDIGPEGTGQYAGKPWRSFAPPATTVDTAGATQDPTWFPREYMFSQTIGGGGSSTTDSAAYIRDIRGVVALNNTSAHAFWASTITAQSSSGGTITQGTLGFTGTASDVIKGFALNY